MKLEAAILALLPFLLQPVYPQKADPAEVRTPDPATLRLTSDVRSQFLGPAFNRVACDDAGNLYARRYVPGAKGTEPIQKIAPTGAVVRAFDANANPQDPFSINDFFVSPDGALYLLGWSTEHVHSGSRVYLLRYGRDGSFISKTQVTSDEYFFPYNLAVFSSGAFVLTGVAGKDDNTPFTAVFSRSGNLVAKISEPEDDELRKAAEEGDSAAHDERLSGNAAVELGRVGAGPDGNVYVMRRTSQAVIYVISPNGRVVRKLHIDSSDPAVHPRDLQFSARGLAVSFPGEGAATMLRTADLNGKEMRTYHAEASAHPGVLACYDSSSLTFLSQQEGTRGYAHIVKLALKK